MATIERKETFPGNIINSEDLKSVAKKAGRIVTRIGIPVAIALSLVTSQRMQEVSAGLGPTPEPTPKPTLPAELPPGDYPTVNGGGWEIPVGPGEARYPVYLPHFDRDVQTDKIGWVFVPPAPNGESYAPFTWFCVTACQVSPRLELNK